MKLVNSVKAFRRLFTYWQNHPLASRDLGGTVIRFFKWQIASRILKAPVIWPWINGTNLVVETGMTGATMNIYCGLHEFADMAFVLHLLRPEDRFVDIGANVGSYTVLAAGVVGAQVMCVEPVPSTFAKLQRNIAVNRIEDRVTAFQCGIGAADGEALAFIADRDTMNQIAPAAYTGATIEVPIRKLDSLLADFDAVLWKIDVEGFEQAVLDGAAETLKNPRLLAVEMEGDTPEIANCMREAGFEKFVYKPFGREFTSVSSSKSSHNWLWIRGLDAVSERCRLAPAYFASNVSF